MAIERKEIKKKRILITAGPTWVPIDKVRVISNVASGETGVMFANILAKIGARVTLILGPVGEPRLSSGVRLIRFKTFDDLKRNILKELKTGRYGIIIHSAAVSDYRPQRYFNGKISSSLKGIKINLIPTEKIIDKLKKIDKNLFVVGFKFSPEATAANIKKEAKNMFLRSGVDLVIANTLRNSRYLAYILTASRTLGPFNEKRMMAYKLLEVLSKRR